MEKLEGSNERGNRERDPIKEVTEREREREREKRRKRGERVRKKVSE